MGANKKLPLNPDAYFGNFLLALAFFLPFNNNLISSVLLACAIIAWILMRHFPARIRSGFRNPFFWLIASPWILEVIGLITSHHVQDSTFKILSKLPVFILPLLLSGGEISAKQKNKILAAFIAGCTLSGLICLFHAFFTYFFLHQNTFFYISFSLFMHTGFYSMYITFCWAVLAYSVFVDSENPNPMRRASMAAMLFLTIILYLLSAKTSYIVLSLLALLMGIQILVKKRNVIPYLLFILASSFCISILFYFFTNTQEARFNNAVHYMIEKNISGSSTESTQLRYLIWKTAFPLFLQKPLTGYSNSNVQEHLDSAYLERNFTGPYKLHLNAMNQFLQSGLASGIIGILLLVVILCLGFFIRNKSYKNFYNYLVVILFINFMTDTVLESQMGILFFALFVPLLFFAGPTDRQQQA